MDEAKRKLIDAYITEQFAEEDNVLREIQNTITENEMPAISLQAHEGRLLQFFAELIGAKKVVEIGTLAGYSATWLARGLPEDGRVYTLEANSKHAAVARANFVTAGLDHKIEIREGTGRELLADLVDEAPFDLLFMDADRPSYLYYLDWAYENLRPGGLVTTHNALQGGRILNPEREWDHAMVAFNQHLAQDPRFSAFLLHIGDGLMVARKK